MKKLTKYFFSFVLGLIVFILIFVIFSQTPIFKNWLRDRLIAEVESQTNAKIRLQKIRGNLFNYIQLENLEIDVAGRPLLKVQKAFLHYDPLALFLKRITLRQVLFESPEFYFAQDADSIWNLNKVIKPDVSGSAPEQKTAPNFDWVIAAPNIQIISASADIDYPGAAPAGIPKQIHDLNLSLGFWYGSNHLKLMLENLSFNTHDPNLQFRTIHSEVDYGPDNFQAHDIKIQTGSSNITSKVEIKNFENPLIDVVLKGRPISLSEIARAVPGFDWHGAAQITFEIHGSLEDLTVRFDLRTGNAGISIGGEIQAKNEPYEYDIFGTVFHLNLAEILHDSTLASDLNARFKIHGKDIEWGKIHGSVAVDLDSSSIGGRQFDPSNLVCEIKHDTLDLEVNLFSEGMAATLNASLISDLQQISYDLKARISNLDLSQFPAPDSMLLTSDLNFSLETQGSGTSYADMSAEVNLQLTSSLVNQIPIDSAQIHFTLNNRIYKVKEFGIFSPLGTVTAAGDLSFHAENKLNVEANLADFSILSRAIPVDSIFGGGYLAVKLAGPIDSLRVKATFDLTDVGTTDLIVKKFKGTGSGLFSEMETSFKVEGFAAEVTAAGVEIDSVGFDIDYADSVAIVELDLKQSERVSALFRGKFRQEPAYNAIDIDDFSINVLDQTWQNGQSGEIRIQNTRIDFSQFELIAGDQKISLTGWFDTENSNSLNLKLTHIDLAEYFKYLDPEIEFEGRFDFEARLAGLLQKPEITAQLHILNVKYLHVVFEELAADFKYADNSFSWTAALSTAEVDSLLEASAKLPVDFTLSPYAQGFRKEAPLELKFNSRGVDISIFEPFAKGVDNLRGLLTADVVFSNSLEDLNGQGVIRVIDGGFDIPELGTKYTRVNLALDLEDKDLLITDLRMRSGGGFIEFLDGGLSLSQDTLQTFTARFRVQNFELMNNKKMRARARGMIELAGSIQSPRFSGQLDVDEAVVNYENWFEDETPVLLTSKPFFVIATDSVEFDTTGAMRFQKEVTREESFTETRWYQNLRGQLSVNFLRNSWIRSKDINIEIKGRVSVVKESPDFVLQGNLSTARGYYNLLGNRFQIAKGNIFFDGDEELDAKLDIEAVYRFLDQSDVDPVNREFKVLITGTLYAPQFQFKLDDRVATQEELISILVYGEVSPNSQFSTQLVDPEANQDTKNDNSKLGAARGILTAQALNALSHKIGEELKLDIIQIERGKDWDESRVRIGKYLTPEVFVSLSQPFGSEGNQKVELEYSIPNKIWFFHLLLQAVYEKEAEGADLIWKIEW